MRTKIKLLIYPFGNQPLRLVVYIVFLKGITRINSIDYLITLNQENDQKGFEMRG